MKKSLLFLTAAALTLASCSDKDDLFGSNDEQTGDGSIQFAPTNTVTSRDSYGATAASKLGNFFVVEGTKGTEQDYSPSLTPVFDNYLVTYTENTAGKTESNTNNWEYVGNQAGTTNLSSTTWDNLHSTGSSAKEQSIKYWDYSTSQYDFVAWSTGTKKAVTTAAGTGEVQVTRIATGTTLSSNAYSFKGALADLKECYITDITTVKTADYNKVVTLKFKNLTSKVRVGLYENVPGYSVKDVQFYTEGTPEINASLSNETATLYSTSSIPQSGTIKVYYPHIGKTYDGTSGSKAADYNKASVDVTAGSTTTSSLGFGTMSNYTTAEKYEAVGNYYLGRTLPAATFGGNSIENYYSNVLPNSTGEDLVLRVNYTLVSTDGSGETIHVYGAKAIVPSTYTKWLSNYAYTYIFKISDNTNGWTSTTGTETPGLFPITFDAVVTDDLDGEQTTVTTVATPSITTYQQNHVYTTNEYAKSTGKDIYVQVMNDALVTNLNAKTTTAAGKSVDRAQLYDLGTTAKTEEDVMDALIKQDKSVTSESDNITGRSGLTLTSKASNLDNTVTTIVNGVTNDPIKVEAGSASKIDISELTNDHYYAYVYDYSEVGPKTIVNQYQMISTTVGTTNVAAGYYKVAYPTTAPETSGTASSDYIYLAKSYNSYGTAVWTQVTVENDITDVTGLYAVKKSTFKQVSASGETAAAGYLYFDVYNENNGKYAVKVIKIVQDAATASLTASKTTVTAPVGTSTLTYRENGKVAIPSSTDVTVKKNAIGGDWTSAHDATLGTDYTITNNNDGTWTFVGKTTGVYHITINGQAVTITVNGNAKTEDPGNGDYDWD